MSERDDKPAKATDDAAVIAECIHRMHISVTADSENRAQAMDDLRFKSGEQWDPAVKAQRVRDQRPCLTMNKLPTFVHQVTNSQRQAVPSINVHPVADGDKEGAEIRQGVIRHIEYASNASVCYDTSVNSAAEIGFGYFRLVTDYCRPDSFDQEIRFARIRNPFTVYMDPAHVNPDGSDQQWCVLSVKVPKADFALEYPDADPADLNAIRAMGDAAHDWADEDTVRLAEYYRINKAPAKVVLLSNGESGYKDDLLELPPGVTIKQERDGYRQTVQWFKLTATQVLDRADIPCRWIPVFPVYGDETDIDGKVFRSGLIRNAKDPARMYNFWMTAATEEVALRPKTPYIGAEGQFEGHESEWAAANTSSFPFLEYKPKSLGGMLAPPPQRQPMADLPSGVLAMAMHASDDIKATTGIFDASLGARSNETSGKAINARDRQGETATFHYIDNLHTTLRHVGRCILDMMPKVYDARRVLQMMGRDGKVTGVEVNVPRHGVDERGQAVQEVLNDMTAGEYTCTVSAGPSYDTMRQEAVDGMIQTAQFWPKLMEIAGDKVVRSTDWPMSQEIADRIEKTIRPELRQGEDGSDAEQQNMVQTPDGPVPAEQAGQMLSQMQHAVQQMQQALQEAQSGVDREQIKAQAAIEVARINAEAKGDAEELKGVIALLLAKLQPPPLLAADVAGDLAEDNSRPGAGPASEYGAQGDGLPMGSNTGPEIAQ
jgi:Phage P22-like portal protein